MKKIGLLIIALFMLFASSVNAKTVTNLTVTQKDGKLSISGTAEAGMLAAQVVVYDEEEKNIIVMESTPVKDDNTYSIDITVPAATYVVKVADYDGGDYNSVKVADGETVSSTDTIEAAKSNPATNDHLATYIAVAGVSLAGIVAAIVYLKKKKTIKNN